MTDRSGQPIQPIPNGSGGWVSQTFVAILRVSGYATIPILTYSLARGVTESSYAFLRIDGLVLFTAILVWMFAAIATKKQRERSLSKAGLGIATTYSLTFALLAAAVFGAWTKELSDRGFVELEPTPIRTGKLVDFYIWRLLDAMPGDITGTLHLNAPFEYDDRIVGILLLSYTVVVTIPVIASFRVAWTNRRSMPKGLGRDVG